MAIDPISRLFLFGDSLTDQGIMHDLTSRNLIVTVPTPDSGYSDAFSNGQVYAQVATAELSVPSDNYAVGGAKAVGGQTFASYVDARVGAQLPVGEIYSEDADPADLAFDLNLGGQVARYVADAGASPPPADAAAAFFIGLNDYSDFVPTSPQAALAEGAALVQAVVGSTITAAAAVAASGVSTILLYTMPSFRFFPLSTLRSEETLVLGDQLIAAHNAGLKQGAALLESLGATVEFIDIARMSAELRADPGTFGLRADLFAAPALLGTGGNPTLIEQPDGSYTAVFAPNPAVAGVDPDQLAFFDFVHPTEALHDVWGIFTADSLDSETLFFGDGNDRIIGTAAKDLILAGAGNDSVAAGAGGDAVLAGLGNDIVSGGKGADILIGGAGRDLLLGGKGSDVIADGAGRDASHGGAGSDLLVDGFGFDVLSGASGGDAFVFVEATLKGGTVAGNGGVFFGGGGRDVAYLVLDAETAASLDSVKHLGFERFADLGLTLVGIEKVVVLGPDDDLVAEVHTTAPIEQAALWGLV